MNKMNPNSEGLPDTTLVRGEGGVNCALDLPEAL